MSNEYFQFRQFRVTQSRAAMKTGTDGVLLGAWPDIPTVTGRVLDVGTGTGLVALMVAQRMQEAAIIGIDIDRGAYLDAAENFAASPFHARLAARHTSLRDYAHEVTSGARPTPLYDLIVCNPPYYDASLPSPDISRNAARHTDTLSFRSLATDVVRLLTADGHFCAIVPTEALRTFTAEMAIAGLCMVYHTAVRTVPHKAARRHLLMFSRCSADDYREQTVCLQEADGTRSEWYAEATREFYI